MSTSIIDDQDLSQVTYTGSWDKGGTSHENAGTVASSTVVGDSFTVSFTGTSIGVYGTLDSSSGGVVTSYSVDGASEVQVTSQASSGDTYHQLFWQSAALSASQHNLAVKLIKVNTNAGPGEGTIWFDYFQVAQASQGLPASTTSISSNYTSSVTSAGATPTISQHDTAAPRKKSIGPVVGGVIAGILCLLLLLFLVLFFMRRRRRERNNSAALVPPKKEIDGALSHSSTGYASLPQGSSRVNVPPTAPSFLPPSNYQNRPPQSNAPSSYSSPPGQSVLYYNNQPQGSVYGGNSSHTPFPEANLASTTASSRPSLSKDNKSTNPSLTLAWMPEPVQHVDSGLRAANPQSDIPPAEIPPVYTEQ